MPVREHYRTISGDEQSLRVGYVVDQVDSEHDALNNTRAAAPTYWPPLPAVTPPDIYDATANQSWVLVNVIIDELDAPDQARNLTINQYYTAAQYAFRATCPIWDFDVGTQSITITEALSTQTFVRTGQTEIAQFGDSIEVSTVGNNIDVRGTNVLRPNSRFALTWNPPFGTTITPLYMRNASEMVGRVNNYPFLEDNPDPFDPDPENPNFTGFDVGEVLMTGFSGRLIDQKNNLWEMRYQFAVNQNQGYNSLSDPIQLGRTGDFITIPEGTVKGWDYVYILREPAVVEDKTSGGAGTGKFSKVPNISQVNVQKIYDTVDFNNLFRANAVATNPLLVRGCPGFNEVPLP